MHGVWTYVRELRTAENPSLSEKTHPMRRLNFLIGGILTACLLGVSWRACAADPPQLPNTQILTIEEDIASQLVEGVDRFLLDQIDVSVDKRKQHWQRNFASPEAYQKSIEPNRQYLAHILGVRDPRISFDAPELIATTKNAALLAKGAGYDVYIIRWPVFGNVHGEGLLLVPSNGKPVADIIAIPDCNQTPEQLVGLAPGVPSESQYARRLAECGCRVIVPVLINREAKLENLTNREWLYRSAFELGRGLIGYELQKILAAIDYFSKESGNQPRIGVIGWGEGGLLALYAGALDSRIDAVCVSGYFDNRNQLWQEPIDRNVFGLLEQFGDAELASMIAPRALIVEAATSPEVKLPGGRGAPARIVTSKLTDVRAELDRARQLVADLKPAVQFTLVASGSDGTGPYGCDETLTKFLKSLSDSAKLTESNHLLKTVGDLPNPAVRLQRQLEELDRHNQTLLRESASVRKAFIWDKLNYESLEKYAESVKPFREYFSEEVIGRFGIPRLSPNPRTRKIAETDKWTRYEVVLDVFPEVIAYGLLTLPKGIKEGEQRPVVVCQHGLEGRPGDTIGESNHHFYKAFATKLAERGFITFAPQNLYIFGDRFRTLQRKANPLKKTLFSIIIPQHQQIVDWLQTLPQVDSKRIAFYGLSYGGKSAMRIPPLVPDYCLSICSGDFNDWIDKTASTHSRYSYTDKTEYEMFEFDLGNTFNYAEMAALIAPRPFMVERGHLDGVAADETVAAEYAKVRRLYDVKLHLPAKTEIEWFSGPHTINGQGTFRFLNEKLNWSSESQ